MDPRIRFLIALSSAIKNGAVKTLKQAMAFAKREFGEIDKDFTNKIINVFKKEGKTKKGDVVPIKKKEGIMAADAATKIVKKRTDDIAMGDPTGETGDLMTGIEKKVESIKKQADEMKNITDEMDPMGDFYNILSGGKARDPRKGMVRAAAREILNKNKIKIGREDPIEVLRKTYGEDALEAVDSIGDELLDTQTYGEINDLLAKNKLFNLVPKKTYGYDESIVSAEKIRKAMEQAEDPTGILTSKQKKTIKDMVDEVENKRALEKWDPSGRKPNAYGGIAGNLRLHDGRSGYQVGGLSMGRTLAQNIAANRAQAASVGKMFEAPRERIRQRMRGMGPRTAQAPGILSQVGQALNPSKETVLQRLKNQNVPKSQLKPMTSDYQVKAQELAKPYIGMATEAGYGNVPGQIQGIGSDVRHTVGASMGKDALIDYVSQPAFLNINPEGKTANIIGNVGVGGATVAQELQDAYKSLRAGEGLAQPLEDVKANWRAMDLPYGSTEQEKLDYAIAQSPSKGMIPEAAAATPTLDAGAVSQEGVIPGFRKVRSEYWNPDGTPNQEKINAANFIAGSAPSEFSYENIATGEGYGPSTYSDISMGKYPNIYDPNKKPTMADVAGPAEYSGPRDMAQFVNNIEQTKTNHPNLYAALQYSKNRGDSLDYQDFLIKEYIQNDGQTPIDHLINQKEMMASGGRVRMASGGLINILKL